jgi:hypothetical protein
VIDLGFCLDLTSSMGIRALAASHRSFVKFCEAEGRVLPILRLELDRALAHSMFSVQQRRSSGMEPSAAWASPDRRSATIVVLAALALFGPKLYSLAVKPKPERVPGDA